MVAVMSICNYYSQFYITLLINRYSNRFLLLLDPMEIREYVVKSLKTPALESKTVYAGAQKRSLLNVRNT